MKKEEVLQLSPLVLAYMGDAVFEKYIREYVIKSGHFNNGQLHKQSIKYVSAKGQSELLKKIDSILTDEEKDIVRRGRNSNPHSTAKNADIVEYKYATGFEALIGFLYLTEQEERVEEIIEKCIELGKGGLETSRTWGRPLKVHFLLSCYIIV